jgi:hypothetical protein
LPFTNKPEEIYDENGKLTKYGQEIESLTAQVSSLRASAKRIALSLQELSDRLQVAVEDVPKGRRFEAERAGNETGRPSVNQSI